MRQSSVPTDHREQFERDFDRAVFSTPVKRLQDKAQVFPLEVHDAVRTRLTHSLEVSSVARGLGIAAGKWLLAQKFIEPVQMRSVEAIAATCGLLHDLGNPPFGHSGEDAIREWFKDRHDQDPADFRKQLGEDDQRVQDFLQFEGNAQTLRLVAKLQILADYYGLNLTYGTLAALCKYSAPSHEVDKVGDDAARKKPGYFASENELIASIRAETGMGDQRNPITFLVEAADDIVYSVADVEDAVKKDVLTWAELMELLGDKTLAPVAEALKRTQSILKSDGSGDPVEELRDDVCASAFRTGVIGVVVKSVNQAFVQHHESIMDGSFKKDLTSVCSAEPLVSRLKTIGKKHVYCTTSTLKLELMGRRVIRELMDVFWEGVEQLSPDEPPKPFRFPGKIATLLSDNYRRAFRRARGKHPDVPETYHRFQLLTDYVCGMTDSFAKRLHAELFNG
ncbi:MAG: dNTP triphosphohydrolase [Phycisphaerales bacterium]|nr:dNTP triphosphohydrolase [Phycisphaerales bacterium]